MSFPVCYNVPACQRYHSYGGGLGYRISGTQEAFGRGAVPTTATPPGSTPLVQMSPHAGEYPAASAVYAAERRLRAWLPSHYPVGPEPPPNSRRAPALVIPIQAPCVLHAAALSNNNGWLVRQPFSVSPLDTYQDAMSENTILPLKSQTITSG